MMWYVLFISSRKYFKCKIIPFLPLLVYLYRNKSIGIINLSFRCYNSHRSVSLENIFHQTLMERLLQYKTSFTLSCATTIDDPSRTFLFPCLYRFCFEDYIVTLTLQTPLHPSSHQPCVFYLNCFSLLSLTLLSTYS